MNSVKQVIEKIIKQVDDELGEDDVSSIVSHLISADVGVKRVENLKSVTVEMLPEDVFLSQVFKADLIQAFQNFKETDEMGRNQADKDAGKTVRAKDQVPMPAPPAAVPRRVESTGFKFTVPWSTFDKHLILNPLQKAKENNRKAPEGVLKALKLAIADKLQIAYKAYRENNPEVEKKTPGRAVYCDISKQLSNKYGIAIDTVINGKIVMNGQTTFAGKLEECMENKSRNGDSRSAARRAVKGSALIGVLLNQYNPGTENAELDAKAQESVRLHLVMVSKQNPDHFEWDSILKDLSLTYNLLREEIIQAKEKVDKEEKEKEQKGKEKKTGNGDENDEEEDVDAQLEGVSERALQTLRSRWPLFFTPAGLQLHATRLTGRNMKRLFDRFVTDHLEIMNMFLITSTTVNITNLILRHSVEKKVGLPLPKGINFLMVIEMLANHLKEPLDPLILTCERTTDPDELPYTLLPSTQGKACIVALDHNMYRAEQFLVCADNTVLISVNDPADAIICLFDLCFALDLFYPHAQAKLMEFLERFVFQMGLSETRITTKQGKPITCVTETVRKLVNSYEELRVIVENGLRQNNAA